MFVPTLLFPPNVSFHVPLYVIRLHLPFYPIPLSVQFCRFSNKKTPPLPFVFDPLIGNVWSLCSVIPN